jgi:tetratricopeptide (TPR) repeat protein/tRNA A-37 threonylcarbamoyl transferase component Bud32
VDAADRYQLRDEIARGGMGVVVRGWDNVLKREVAVKLLHPQLVGSAAERQFLEEANVTGQLQHPGIPPVYDLGTFADGRSFLAMKLVRGRTLAALLKDSPGDRGRWVGVFEGVCQAVGYAHREGVVHRDLKPSNVMVGEFGEVQVMDWGLAKVLARGRGQPAAATPPTAAVGSETASDGSATTGEWTPAGAEGTTFDSTRDGTVLGSPAYMPPEQARGEVAGVGERSDVFGLGGVLCAILTGKPPFAAQTPQAALERAARADLADAVGRLDQCGADPELVALCKRCLAADPADRPADGGEVAAAVAAFRLATEERAQRAERDRHAAEIRAAEQARRRRAVQRWAGAVAAVLALGVVGTAFGLVRADRARRAAVTARDKAAAARDQALDALDAVTSDTARDALIRQAAVTPEQQKFLTTVLDRYRALAEEQADDEAARWRVAKARFQVGTIEYRLGRPALAEEAFRISREELRRLAEENPDRLEYRSLLGRSAGNLAIVLLDARRSAEAEVVLQEGLPVWDRMVAEAPDDPKPTWGRAKTRTLLARALGDLNRRDAAVAAFRSADSELSGASASNKADYRIERGVNLSNFANVLVRFGRAAEAEAEAGKAVAVLQALVAEQPEAAIPRSMLAEAVFACGAVRLALGRSADAVADFQMVAAARERLAADFPADPLHRQQLAAAQNETGRAHALGGRLPAAEAPFRAAVATAERLAADHPTRDEYRQDVAKYHSNLGQLLVQLNRPAEAEPLLQAVAAVRQAALSANPASVPALISFAEIQSILGQCHRGLRRYDRAEAAYRAALDAAEKVAAARPADPGSVVRVAGLLSNLGVLLSATGRHAEAVALFTRSADALAPAFATAPNDLTVRIYLRNANGNRAEALGKLGRHADALPAWDRALELASPAEVPRIRTFRAYARVRAGRSADAVAETNDLAADPRCPADRLYALGCVVALAAAADPARRDEYAGRAVELLRRAKVGGFSDLARMAADDDLAVLRDRPDFRSLTARREPAPPPREPVPDGK